jgi:EpsI family protein
MLKSKAQNFSILILLTAITFVVLITQRGEPMVVRTNLENLPMQIGEYVGTEDTFPVSVYEELNADRHVYRHYRAPDGSQIDLYIGYYGTAKGGRTGHNPYACLPGAGWGIIEDRKAEVPFGNGKVTVNALVARKGSAYETVLHWYQSDSDKVLATGFQQNIQRLVGRIKHNRNDGAFVRLSMLTQRENIKQTKEILNTFAKNVLTTLPLYWPEER